MIFGGTINAMVTILAHGVVNPKKGANVMEICRRRVKEAVMVFGVTAMVMRPHPRLPQVHHPQGGVATTTRYWDCAGGACGCAYIPLEGNTNKPAHCYRFVITIIVPQCISFAIFSYPHSN